jgi:D-amino-acid dehydrogenase
MRIPVPGSGVIGTTCACYLARAGHQVTVIDRHKGPGSMLRNCTEARYARNQGHMVRLAECCRDCVRQLRAKTNIQYDQRTQGTLKLFRTQKQLDGTAKDIEILKRYGAPCELLDRPGYITAEPALAEGLGVKFHHGVNLRGIASNSAHGTGVATDQGLHSADACLVALGSCSPPLLRPIGIRLPVYPVKGCSITVPIEDASWSPESTDMDETHKVTVTRLGDRIRVGGTAEPPDGTPVVGGSPYPNLYLATAHGTLGWTMAAGTGRVMADLMSGKPTDIRLDGLTAGRCGQAFAKPH